MDSNYFTNDTGDVFALRLPGEIAAALIARYSRSSKGLRQLFYDEFLNEETDELHSGYAPETSFVRARDFHRRVFSGYGDESVAKLASAYVCCENISGIAALWLNSFRIGIAAIEKSTRYVRFDDLDENGLWKFHTPEEAQGAKLVPEYVDLQSSLFSFYSSGISFAIHWLKQKKSLDGMKIRNPKTGEEKLGQEWLRDEENEKWLRPAYDAAIRANACDIFRGVLPIATRTNVGLLGTGLAWRNLIANGLSSDISEICQLAEKIKNQLMYIIPSFVEKAEASEYLKNTHCFLKNRKSFSLTGQYPPTVYLYPTTGDRPYSYSFNQEQVIRAIGFEYPNLIKNYQTYGDKVELIKLYSGERRNRFDKPGRALESADYTFRIQANLGIFRDLRRHQLISIENEPLQAGVGFTIPKEIEEMGLGEEFHRHIGRAGLFYHSWVDKFPTLAQYIVPLACSQVWYMKINLRELLFLCELRTQPSGHPDYRLIAQNMWNLAMERDPIFQTIPNFVDFSDYQLGRMGAEVRSTFRQK